MRWVYDNWGWLLFGAAPLVFFTWAGVIETIRRSERHRVTGKYEPPPSSGTDYWT